MSLLVSFFSVLFKYYIVIFSGYSVFPHLFVVYHELQDKGVTDKIELSSVFHTRDRSKCARAYNRYVVFFFVIESIINAQLYVLPEI